ncbi:hypothetical protein ACIF85_43080 [Streptomyces sp. NPDC086033]|uniref:hypothetical protein n=1 Tax=Streptomyces sp. NPDC086033 TaxID=3365747 RepID=UPI0037CD890B
MPELELSVVERSPLSAAKTAVAGHLQNLLEQLAPEQPRELGIALSVSGEMVALELVEEAAAGRREFQARTMAEYEAEMRLHDDRSATPWTCCCWKPPTTGHRCSVPP